MLLSKMVPSAPQITASKTEDKETLLLLLLCRFSCVRLCATPQMAAHQAALSLGFSRQEYWSGLPWTSVHIKDTVCKMPDIIDVQ